MNALLRRPGLALSLAVLLAAWGGAAWLRMPRWEDPRLPPRWAFLVIPYPGAAAPDVEHHVVDPVERELWRVRDVVRVDTTARIGAAVAEIEISHETRDPDRAWDDVRRALDAARASFPPGVGSAELDVDVITPDAVVLAVQAASAHERLEAARELERELLVLPEVSRVTRLGDPGEQIAIELDDAAARRAGLTPSAIAHQLMSRSEVQPTGVLRTGGPRVTVEVSSAFASIDALRQTPIPLPSGGSVPLETLASVGWRLREPAIERMRLDGADSIGIAVGPARQVDVPQFGRDVLAAARAFEQRHPGVAVRVALFQPEHVEARLVYLRQSLLAGMALVVALLMGTLGLRLGLVVAASIPVVTLTALALYAAGGGALHQMSIAALLIVLGMTADNAIVVVEAVERRVAAGADPRSAARESLRELALPLASATLTTIAAFVPMLLARGTAADFVRAIPILVCLGLALSYASALGFTPALAVSALALAGRPRPRRRPPELLNRIARLGATRPVPVVCAALAAVALCAAGMPLVERSFFPFADRAQLVASLDFGEGAHLDASDRGAQRLERELLRDPDVASVSAFVGRSSPLFYYNLNRHPHSAHLAQLVVSARDRADLGQLAERARELARTEVPEATLVVKRLRQGTPVDAPIELRLYGRELAALADAAERVVRGLRGVAGTRDVRDDLGRGAPVLRFEVDAAAASRHGLSHSHVARTLRERASGLVVGQYRGGRDPVPIVLTSDEGEALSIERLSLLEVGGPDGGSVSLGQIAELDVGWEPAVLRRSGARRVVTVLADLEPGVTAQGVLDELDLSSLGLSPEIQLEIGGEIEGARDATRELVRHLPLGALLMSACLLIELHSLRLVGVVLSSLLLAAAGIVPGLIVGRQPLGFMALLGVVGVGGIVVNNGIVLVDAVRRRRERGRPLEAAVRMAVVGRARSLLLTSATQLAGLFPLALSRTELWPPMAWPMITGLLASTALGLVVQPALCRLALTPRRPLA